MEIDAGITILFSSEGLKIEVKDNDANVTFLKVELDTAQTCMALSRLGNTSCTAGVYGLDKVGKVMEHKPLEFPLGTTSYESRKELAVERVKDFCPEGWTPDNYFGSQGSFFTKEEETWARCNIRRWVDKPQ